MQLISCSNRLGIRSNRSSYLLKMVSRSNGSSCPCKKKIVICLSGLGYLFKKNCQLFEWLELSVQKKMFSVGTAQAIRWKKLSAIRTARAICSKKIGNRSKARSSYLFEEEFCWVSIPEQLPHQLLVSNDLLFSMYSWVVPLRTLFTNVSWIVTVLFLPLPHLFVIHSAIPFRTAWLPRPHLLVCGVFVYRALFIRNIFEWEVTYLKWMELLWNNCTIHCTIHCSYWNNLYQNDFVFNNQLMIG